MEKRSYTVLVHKAEEGGFWTSVPAIPGVGSQGETRDVAIAMTNEAIHLIQAVIEDGTTVPDDVDAIAAVEHVSIPA